MIVRVAPITRRGQHDKSVGSIRGFFVWNSELRNASMPQLARMLISSGKTAGRAGSGVGHCLAGCTQTAASIITLIHRIDRPWQRQNALSLSLPSQS